jgi:hypothetical protein
MTHFLWIGRGCVLLARDFLAGGRLNLRQQRFPLPAIQESDNRLFHCIGASQEPVGQRSGFATRLPSIARRTDIVSRG